MVPILSIIIPHYNIPHLLERLLNTIPLRDDIQIIVVDDYSTELLNEYNNVITKHPHVLFTNNTGNNKGGGAARNAGLKIATGKWILFADADDMFIEGFYESVKVWFEKECDIVCFPPISKYVDSGEIYGPIASYTDYINNYEESKSKFDENILRYMWLTPWSRLIRRDIIDKNNILFSETIRANDMLFSAKVSYYAKNVATSNNSIYINLIRGSLVGNIQTRPEATKLIYSCFINERIKKYCFLREVLPEKEFYELPLHGILYVLIILLDGNPPHSHFSVKNIPLALNAFKVCKKNKVKMFHKNFFKPGYIKIMASKWYSRKINMKNIKYY